MYKNGFSRLTGVVGRTVYALAPLPNGLLCAGAPVTPEKTKFHTFPLKLPIALLRVYHCCWEQALTLPLTTVSAMNPPLASPQFVLVSSIAALTYMRRNAAPCETPHCSTSPAGGVMYMFS